MPDGAAELAADVVPEHPAHHVATIATTRHDALGPVQVREVLQVVYDELKVAVRRSEPVAPDTSRVLQPVARAAGDVGEDDNVALLGQRGRVPRLAPGVAPGCDRTAVYAEQPGVLFCLVKVAGTDDECMDRVAIVAGKVGLGYHTGREAELGMLVGGGCDGTQDGAIRSVKNLPYAAIYKVGAGKEDIVPIFPNRVKASYDASSPESYRRLPLLQL